MKSVALIYNPAAGIGRRRIRGEPGHARELFGEHVEHERVPDSLLHEHPPRRVAGKGPLQPASREVERIGGVRSDRKSVV